MKTELINQNTIIQPKPQMKMTGKEVSLSNLLLSRQENVDTGPHISIYLPDLDCIPGQSRQSKIHSRRMSLLRHLKLAMRLVQRDVPGAEGRQTLKRLQDHVASLDLFVGDAQSDHGVALFLSPEFSGHFNIPKQKADLAVVATSFHLKPVFDWIQGSPAFYLVTTTLDRCVLFEGDIGSLKPKLVVSNDQLEVSDPERVTLDKHKTSAMIDTFMRRCAKIFQLETLTNRKPIILAGQPKATSSFAKAMVDPDLVAKSIRCNIERCSIPVLLEQCRDVLNQERTKLLQKTIERISDLQTKNLSSIDLQEIGRQAALGNIQNLLIASDRNSWGYFIRQSGEIIVHDMQMNAFDDDVLDDIAEYVLAKGGRVLCVPSDQLPGQGLAAAIFRNKTGSGTIQ